MGTGFVELLEMFEKDVGTHAVVLVGEIGGEEEEQASEYIAGHMSTPVVGFISGKTAPPGKRMGHAGAIISGGRGTAEAKLEAFREAGVRVADRPDEVPHIISELLQS